MPFGKTVAHTAEKSCSFQAHTPTAHGQCLQTTLDKPTILQPHQNYMWPKPSLKHQPLGHLFTTPKGQAPITTKFYSFLWKVQGLFLLRTITPARHLPAWRRYSHTRAVCSMTLRRLLSFCLCDCLHTIAMSNIYAINMRYFWVATCCSATWGAGMCRMLKRDAKVVSGPA